MRQGRELFADGIVAVVETVLIAAGFVVLFFLLPHELFHDDLSRFDDIRRLREDGELTDNKYSLVMPLFSAPLLALGDAGLASPEWWAERFNVVVVAVGALVTFALLRRYGDPVVKRRCLLVLLFASYLTNRLRDYNNEVFTATLIVVGIVMLATGRSRVLGWGAIVVAAVNTPAAAVGLACVAVVQLFRERRLRHLLPLFAAAALIMGEAWLRRGSPFESGYSGARGVATILPYSGEPEFSYPFVLGALSILVSFGRGLVFFMPGLLLWLSSRTRREAEACWPIALLMLVFLAGLVLVYAKWWAWYGGISWGPRFFVFAAVPASLAIAVRIARAGASVLLDAVTLLILALSAWVALSGAVADSSDLTFCEQNRYALESLCWYVPEYSSLWRPFLDFPPVGAAEAIVIAYVAVVFAWLALPVCAGLAGARHRLGPRASGGRSFGF